MMTYVVMGYNSMRKSMARLGGEKVSEATDKTLLLPGDISGRKASPKGVAAGQNKFVS